MRPTPRTPVPPADLSVPTSAASSACPSRGRRRRGIPILLAAFRERHGLEEDAIEFRTTQAEDGEVHGRRSLEIVLDRVRKSMERLVLFEDGIGRG